MTERSEYERGFDVHDDTLKYNHKAIDLLFTRGRHEGLDVYCLSGSFF